MTVKLAKEESFPEALVSQPLIDAAEALLDTNPWVTSIANEDGSVTRMLQSSAKPGGDLDPRWLESITTADGKKSYKATQWAPYENLDLFIFDWSNDPVKSTGNVSYHGATSMERPIEEQDFSRILMVIHDINDRLEGHYPQTKSQMRKRQILGALGIGKKVKR